MNLKCTKKEVKDLIELYYKEEEGKQVKVSIKTKKQCVGLYEETGCVTTISVKEEVDILGMKKQMEFQLSKEELQDILNILLEKKGYTVTKVTYDSGIDRTYEFDDYKVEKPYFNGIDIEVNDKIKAKTKQRGL